MKKLEFVSAGLANDPEYNSLGFRCKEFDDINFDNYIIFAGSSHVEGVGVEKDQTFAHLVSEVLECDHVNLGVGGGGIDAVEHNVLMWFMKYDKHPKEIVIEWPIYQRFVKDVYGEENLCPGGSWSDPRFVTYADHPLYIKGEMAYRNLHKLLPVKITDVMHGKISSYTWNSSVIWHCKDDIGTDGEHPGPKSHLKTSENILEVLNR